MDNHVEIKDRCNSLDTRLEELAADIRDLPTDYRLISKYNDIDGDLQKMYDWYHTMKDVLKQYSQEKCIVEAKLEELKNRTKSLNNEIQNIKLREFSHDQHGGSYSQLHHIQRP